MNNPPTVNTKHKENLPTDSHTRATRPHPIHLLLRSKKKNKRKRVKYRQKVKTKATNSTKTNSKGFHTTYTTKQWFQQIKQKNVS